MAESVELELWNIFLHYTLLGNPFDPKHMKSQQWLQWAKECNVYQPPTPALDGSSSRRRSVSNSKPRKGLAQPELVLIYTAEVARRKRRYEEVMAKRGSPLRTRSRSGQEGKTKLDFLDYDGFLNCLLEVAGKLFPFPPLGRLCASQDEALQLLLMDHVLPLATRKDPVSVSTELNDQNIAAVGRFFSRALLELFQFYATEKEGKRGKSGQSESSYVGTISDDMTISSFSINSRNSYSKINSKKEYLRYDRYLRFAQDFGLTNFDSISMYDVGHIYLSCISMRGCLNKIRQINFEEFWEILIRFAVKVYQSIEDVSVENKVKALILYICSFAQESLQRIVTESTASPAQIIRAVQLLNEKATAQWQSDNCCNYLQPGASQSSKDGDPEKNAQDSVPDSSPLGSRMGGRAALNRLLRSAENTDCIEEGEEIQEKEEEDTYSSEEGEETLGKSLFIQDDNRILPDGVQDSKTHDLES